MSAAVHLLESIEKKVSMGKVSVQLARLYLRQNEWGKTVAAVHEGLRKGGLDSNGEAYWLLAICYWKMGYRAGAKEYFKKTSRQNVGRQSRRLMWQELHFNVDCIS